MASLAQLQTALLILRILTPSLALAALAFKAIAWALNTLFQTLQTHSQGYAPLLSPTLTANLQRQQFGRDDAPIDITVKQSQPRRFPIYSLLSLVAASYFADAAISIAFAVWTSRWESTGSEFWRFEMFYTLAGLSAYLICQIMMAWQERKDGPTAWSPSYPRAAVITSAMGEIALFGILIEITKRNQRVEWHNALTILHLTLQASRILLLLIAIPLLFPIAYQKSFVLADRQATYGTFQPMPSPPTEDNKDNSPGTPTKSDFTRPTQPKGLKGIVKRLVILSPYLWPSKSRPLQAVALVCFMILACGRVVNFFVPRMLGKVVEALSNEASPWTPLFVYVTLRFFQGSGGILNVLQSNLWIPVAQYSEREMSKMSFEHLLNLSLEFHVRKKTGEILRILDRGSAINNFFQMILFSILPIFVDIGVAIIYLAFSFGGLLAGLIFLVMVAYVLVSVLLTNYRVKLRRQMNDKDKYVRGIHADALANWETIKLFVAEQWETSRYTRAMLDFQKAEFAVLASLNFLNLIQNFIISLGLLGGTLIVAYSVVEGKRSVGQFVMFLTYLTQLYQPLNQLGTLYRVIQTNVIDTDQLMNLLAEKTEVNDRPNAVTLTQCRGEIEFNNVSFSYDGKVTALKNITATIPAGKSCALVGESGSGKSTLFRLLYRFYDLNEDQGSIKIDGHDIRDLTQASLRAQIGVVPQEAILFNDTIGYNISYGNPKATVAQMEEAAKSARIYDRIMGFPDQFNTVVGERGVRLSGGEKQRCSIARTMLKKPAILALDEASSALDTRTEREIQESLKNAQEGRTSIAIAHRLSTIINCDIIFVLAEGVIAEQGTHEELLEANGLYARLWEKQIRAERQGTRISSHDSAPNSGQTSEAVSRAVSPLPPVNGESSKSGSKH